MTKKLAPPRLKYLGSVDGLKIYLVSGEKIRNEIDIDFTQGGNEAAYPRYNPPGEIWIDDAMHALDRIATAFHEIMERHLVMKHGEDYDLAHAKACAHEILFRKKLASERPKKFDARRVSKEFHDYLRALPPAPKGVMPGKASRW
jgi:hypothetical protein